MIDHSDHSQITAAGWAYRPNSRGLDQLPKPANRGLADALPGYLDYSLAAPELQRRSRRRISGGPGKRIRPQSIATGGFSRVSVRKRTATTDRRLSSLRIPNRPQMPGLTGKQESTPSTDTMLAGLRSASVNTHARRRSIFTEAARWPN